MTEDISQDHPDHMRIVIALNAGQCPDCGTCGFDLKPRVDISRNIFCKACDQGFNVSPALRRCISCSALAADRARNIRDDHPRVKSWWEALHRYHSCRGERRQPRRHADHDLEPLGSGDHISLRRTIPKCGFDIREGRWQACERERKIRS